MLCYKVYDAIARVSRAIPEILFSRAKKPEIIVCETQTTAVRKAHHTF